ncbi:MULTISPECIES: hypothetical protein [unclassified Sphingobium]|uniref:hypothetical protein n=1 Tax=unclassified Sphingobium TaxID=2611147 RepID=UPI0035A6E194
MTMLIALAAAAATHSVTIEHHGQTIGATYVARAETSARTVGAKTGARMNGQRCHWTVAVMVDRRLDHGPAHARTIATDQRFSGNDAGACTGDRERGAAILARHRDAIAQRIVAIAQADRAPLLAELDSARALAVN